MTLDPRRSGYEGPLVAVIIPAYNAARTIDSTLWSVRNQTHSILDIVVVDDGSTDATVDIVARHAEDDPRVRLISQKNAGVAAARNRGIAQTRAEFVAPVDADDLWHPTKLEKQLALMLEGGERVGLVYSWSVTIDEDGMIVGLDHHSDAEGDVIVEMCRRNFLGNASSALIRRAAILKAGGYDSALREMGGQGCEDWLLYLAIADVWRFGVVKEYLTGYRVVEGNMSSNVLSMWRSHQLVSERMTASWPHRSRYLAESRRYVLSWLARRALLSGNWSVGGWLFARLVAASPMEAMDCFIRLPTALLRKGLGPALRTKLKSLLIGARNVGEISPGKAFLAPGPGGAGARSRSNSARLGIAICTHNRPVDLGHCLAAVCEQLTDHSAQIVVVDSGSTPDMAKSIQAVCEAHPGVRLLRLSRPGLSYARNAAISALTSTDWIAFLDDDARPEAGWLSGIYRAIDSSAENCGAIAGCVYPLWPTQTPPQIDPLWVRLLSLVYDDDDDEDAPAPAQLAKLSGANVFFRSQLKGSVRFAGANLLFRTAPLQEIGGFDLDLGRTGDDLLGGEEIYAVHALDRRGWSITFHEDIRVKHSIPSDRLTWEWIARRADQEGVTSALLALKLEPAYLMPAVLVKACVGMLIYGAAITIKSNRNEFRWAYLIRRSMMNTLWEMMFRTRMKTHHGS